MTPEEAALRAHAIWAAKQARGYRREAVALFKRGLREDAVRHRMLARAYVQAFGDAKLRIRCLHSSSEEARRFATTFH